MNVNNLMADLERKHPGESEYLQAVREVLESIEEVYNDHPEFESAKIVERMVEPDRIITFRVTWVDDKGEIQTNLGYRVQFNSAIGPYKGGIRFHAAVNPSMLKFLGFEQTFKNALTTLPMGGAKGGSDFSPKGKSDAEKSASSALFEGDYHREHEIKHICDNVINASSNASVTNWLLMGDFNSISRADEEHYATQTSNTVWLVHDYLLSNTYMKDIIADCNAPEDYFSSINGDSRRIDYMYASPAMYDRIQSAAIVIDSWTVLSQDKNVTSGYFCRPSDHRPILVDFKMN